MHALKKLDLDAVVPPNAWKVSLRYEFADEFGGVLLHRSLTDTNPIHLCSPGGTIEVEFLEPQTLYVQQLDGCSDWKLVSSSYSWR